MTILDRLNSPKCDFTQNRSGGKIIKVTQCQALTSHFESFWSIVPRYNGTYCISLTLYITFTENKVIESITTSNSGEERFTTSPLPPVGIPDQQWPLGVPTIKKISSDLTGWWIFRTIFHGDFKNVNFINAGHSPSTHQLCPRCPRTGSASGYVGRVSASTGCVLRW